MPRGGPSGNLSSRPPVLRLCAPQRNSKSVIQVRSLSGSTDQFHSRLTWATRHGILRQLASGIKQTSKSPSIIKRLIGLLTTLFNWLFIYIVKSFSLHLTLNSSKNHLLYCIIQIMMLPKEHLSHTQEKTKKKISLSIG